MKSPPRNKQGQVRKAGIEAFTLIELLVVIAVIAIMMGVLVGSFRGGNQGTALQSAQATLASMLAGARGQAALAQNQAKLIIDGDPTSDGFLRTVRIVVGGTVTNQWRVVGEAVTLPQGIYFVPSSTSFANVSFSPPANAAWPSALVSTAIDSGAAVALTYEPNTFSLGTAPFLSVKTVSPLGTMTAGQLVLGTAERSGNTVVFTNPELLRGVKISNYGVATLINDGNGFK